MAANCVIISKGMPVWIEDEKVVCNQTKCSLTVDGGSSYPGMSGNYKGKGKIYLTNFRMVMLKENPNAFFSSFSFPYKHIRKLKHKKPMIGASHISGTVIPVPLGGLHGEAKFRVKFEDSNNSVLLNFFEKLQQQQFNATSSPSDGHDIVTRTPSLNVKQIFPDQFRNGKSAHQKTVSSPHPVRNFAPTIISKLNLGDDDKVQRKKTEPITTRRQRFQSEPPKPSPALIHKNSKTKTSSRQPPPANRYKNTILYEEKEHKSDSDSSDELQRPVNMYRNVGMRSDMDQKKSRKNKFSSNTREIRRVKPAKSASPRALRTKAAVVAGQSAQDAPTSLTRENRPHAAALFPQKSKSLVTDPREPVVGATAVNLSSFAQNKGTIIRDREIRRNPYSNYSQRPRRSRHQKSRTYANSSNRKKYTSQGLHDAFQDPNNPDDILITLPSDELNEGGMPPAAYVPPKGQKPEMRLVRSMSDTVFSSKSSIDHFSPDPPDVRHVLSVPVDLSDSDDEPSKVRAMQPPSSPVAMADFKKIVSSKTLVHSEEDENKPYQFNPFEGDDITPKQRKRKSESASVNPFAEALLGEQEPLVNRKN